MSVKSLIVINNNTNVMHTIKTEHELVVYAINYS